MATSSRDPGPGHHGAAAWSRLVWVCPGSGRRNARSICRGSPGQLGGAAWQPGTPAPPWAQDAWALPGVRGQGIRGDVGAAPASSRAARLLAPVAREDEASLAEAGLCRVCQLSLDPLGHSISGPAFLKSYADVNLNQFGCRGGTHFIPAPGTWLRDRTLWGAGCSVTPVWPALQACPLRNVFQVREPGTGHREGGAASD